MDAEVAEQIATLLNNRNELTRQYDAARVLEHADSYLYLTLGAEVSACIKLSRVQWYQVEIGHLTVAEAHERLGYGRQLVKQALTQAAEQGARVAQCTIREGEGVRIFV